MLTHPFLDWLTTYAIAIFAPSSWNWYSGNAIFIVDWVYWVLMIIGIGLSTWRWRRNRPNPGRPAQIAGLIMLAYIGLNLAESAWVEQPRQPAEPARDRASADRRRPAAARFLGTHDRVAKRRPLRQRQLRRLQGSLSLDPAVQPLASTIRSLRAPSAASAMCALS